MMLQQKRAFARIATVSLAVLVSFSTASAGDKYAVKAGKVITMAGDDIENGVVVIEGGRITAVGPLAEVEIPWDAEVLDVPDLVAAPGWVEAHSTSGMDRPNENIPVTPFLNIRDSIDPVSVYFEDSLRWGVMTINVQQGARCVIGGQGMVVTPFGMTVEEMLVDPRSGLKMSTVPKQGKSRAAQAQALRRAFGDLQRHLAQLVEENKDGDDRARREALYQGRELDGERAKGRAMGGSAWIVEGLERIPRGLIDEKLEPLLDVVEGRLPVWFHCGEPMDVALAIEVATANGFLDGTTLVVDPPCWKAADEIAAAGVSVVLDGELMHIARDPVSGEEIETFVPDVYREKGIPFALHSENSSSQSLWYQAAFCVGQGMDRGEALASITTVPAEMLGLSDRVGSLQVGRDGKIVLYSGDPLSVTSFVEYVLLDGELVYDRSQDVRARHLLHGEVPKNTSAVGEEEEAPHVHEHEGEGEGEGEDEDDEDDEENENGDEGDGDAEEGEQA